MDRRAWQTTIHGAAEELQSMGLQKSCTWLSNSTTITYMYTWLRASQHFLVSVCIKWTKLEGWFLRSQVLKSGLESVVVLSFENSSTYWLSEVSLHWDQCCFMSLPIFKNIVCLYGCWHIYKSLWIPKIRLWRECILNIIEQMINFLMVCDNHWRAEKHHIVTCSKFG